MNYMYMYLNILIIIILMIFILIGLSFLTLLERKILSMIQNRKGPNKVSIKGLIQPFSDGIKLFSKELILPLKLNNFLFYIMPLLMIFMMLLIWISYPNLFNLMFMNYSFLFIFCCLSMSTIIFMILGWSSFSNYSMLGAIRSISQMISYEVIFLFMFMILIFLNEKFNLMIFIQMQIYFNYFFFMFFLFLIFLIIMLVELNRTPTDLIEGESELVSGFNIEFSSILFSLIFMGEYGMIMFMMMILMIMFYGINFNNLIFYLIFMFFCFWIIWVRGTLCRIRYDDLMYLCWKIFLMIILNIFLYMLIFKYFLS